MNTQVLHVGKTTIYVKIPILLQFDIMNELDEYVFIDIKLIALWSWMREYTVKI